MSVYRLGPHWVHRLRDETAVNVVAAWTRARGTGVVEFVTAEHRHGRFDRKLRVWGWLRFETPACTEHCALLGPRFDEEKVPC